MSAEPAADTLLVEPFSGASGDMLLGALLGLGDPRFTLAELRALGQALVPGECSIDAEVVWRGSLSGTLVSVRTAESARAPHRGLADCERLVRAAPLPASAAERAVRVFRRIAQAEARVHGTTPDAIHFHEVGAVDALVDVCGVCLALDRLGVAHVLSTPPVVGEGTLECAHGTLPVPAPGTAEILRGLPVVLGGGSGERLTPTGAALLAECVERFEAPGLFAARAIGYGAGQRDPPDGPPNVLRVQLGTQLGPAPRAAEAWQLEVNLDDMSGEELGFLVEELRAADALDVWTTPAQMKKGRPGVVVAALCRAEARAGLERVAFARSTTLGVRWTRCERSELPRASLEVEVAGATVRVKRRLRAGGGCAELDLSPEQDDLARLARASGRSLRDLEREARAAALRQLAGDSAQAERGRDGAPRPAAQQ